MWLSVTLAVIVVFILWRIRSHLQPKINLDHIPGPSESIIWSLITASAPDPTKFHLHVSDLARRYGRVMKIPQLNTDPFVVLNDSDAIHKALVTFGKETGGRPMTQFRWRTLLQDSVIVGNSKPDETWKVLKRLTLQHLKQFTGGQSILEINIKSIAEDMFQEFEKNCGQPYDPFKIAYDTSTETNIYLATGQCLASDHPVVIKMKEYESKFFQFVAPYAPMSIMMLDFFPWLRYFGWPGYEILLKTRQLEREIWTMLLTLNEGSAETDSVTASLNANHIDEFHSRKTTLMLLTGGGPTLTAVLYGAINVLAHHEMILETMYEEVKTVAGTSTVSLSDQAKTPYTRATILELLRYLSVGPFGAQHQTLSDVTICGYHIPEGTPLLMNYFHMHWNPDIWGDPEVFRPGRFLDDAGLVLAPDHPRRKNLMSFGAGTRVCPGQDFAMSRIFLWIATFAQRFKVKPAEDNFQNDLLPENSTYSTSLLCKPYRVILEKRTGK